MLYHTEIGFPSIFRAPVGNFALTLSRHARDRAREKSFTIPRSVEMNDFEIIEIEIIKNRLTKMVIRGEYDNYDDICIVVIPQRNGFFVKTAWLNAWDDKHNTLDHTKYGRP